MKSVSGKEFCKALERHGFRLNRIQSSHFIFMHPEKRQILSVPVVHGARDLKIGTLKALLKAAGLTESDL